MWRGQQQLSHMPCPAPSPSCSGDDDSSATRPAWPHLLCVATMTTAQPRALPSCSGSNDSSGCTPHPISFMQQWRQQLRPCATPCLLCVVVMTTAQDAHPAPSPLCSGVLSPTLGDEIVLQLCIPLALKLAYIKVIGQPIGFDWSCLEFNMGMRAWTHGVGDKGSGSRDGEGRVCCRSLQYSL